MLSYFTIAHEEELHIGHNQDIALPVDKFFIFQCSDVTFVWLTKCNPKKQIFFLRQMTLAVSNKLRG